MHRRARLALLATACLLALAAPLAHAAVPRAVSFQGMITDGTGHTVADGSYDLSFAIYAAASGGAALWSEAHPGVAVSGGGFTVLLGATTPMPASFDTTCWLGTTLSGNPEMSPRLQMAASPSALSLVLPYSGSVAVYGLYAMSLANRSGWGGDLHLDHELIIGNPSQYATFAEVVASPTTTLWPRFSAFADSSAGTTTIAARGAVSTSPSATMAASATAATVTLSQPGSASSLTMSSGAAKPSIAMNATGSQILLDLGLSGDASVQLPAGAIDPAEMTGAPGIAQNTWHGGLNYVSVPGYGGGIGDIISVTITTPVAGYITVDAAGTIDMAGTSGSNSQVTYTIDEGSGGFDSEARAAGVAYANATISLGVPLNALRTYYKAAGTYTFHLRASTTGSGSLGADITSPVIRATFLPVSYGAVTTMASGPDAADIPGAERLPARAGAPEYAVDLRQLEQRAQAAQAEADRARAALQAARARADAAGVQAAEELHVARTAPGARAK